MKRLLLLIWLMIIGCSNPIMKSDECFCGFNISSDLPQTNGIYELEFNPASMTDEDGNGNIVFAVWEEFVDKTITIYGGYTDDCGHHFVDSLKVKVVDNE